MMFCVPMFKVFLVVGRLVSVAASFRLSLQLVIHCLRLPCTAFGGSVATKWFLRGRVASPTRNLPPFSAGLRTVHDGVGVHAGVGENPRLIDTVGECLIGERWGREISQPSLG